MKRSEWQPIETAPKDGTRILAYCLKKGNFSVCFYCPFLVSWHQVDPRDFGHIYMNATPNYWMPLPPPPEANNETQ